ncbi:MAG: DinB family protein [Chloroflexi bacterium OLB15]|nr:MAG: DinB family protein [Chloroflexi bacterium OLB15]
MTLDYLRTLYDYNYWAHNRVWGCVMALSDEQFTRDTGFSWRSIRGQMVHVMSAEWMWFMRINGTSPQAPLSEADFPTREKIREEWYRVEGMVRATVEGLNPDALDEIVVYHNTKGDEYSEPLWQILLHVINHSTDHRAQILAMIYQLGGATVEQDLILYLRQFEGFSG